MFSFASNPTSIYVKFSDNDSRAKKTIKIAGQSKTEEMVLFLGHEIVSGTVEVVLPPGKNVDHLGIKIEMIGQIGEFLFRVLDQRNCRESLSIS
jgi:hypothetical protein